MELTNAGQAFRLARYAMHFHLMGDVTNTSYVSMHFSDVIWTPWRLRSLGIGWLFNSLFTTKIRIKDPHYWPFVKGMLTSSNGNFFRFTGPKRGEFTGHWWIPPTKASDAELWCFFLSVPWINGWVKKSWKWWFDTPSRSLWRHCNGPFIKWPVMWKVLLCHDVTMVHIQVNFSTYGQASLPLRIQISRNLVCS